MQYDAMNFMLFFLIYGFLGFLLESVFRSFTDRKIFISRGFLTKGFCPLYGICAILIIEIFTLCELSINNPLWALICATAGSIAAVTLLEYITGRMLDRVFHYKLWDYSAYPLNLHSYICLEFSLLWGILALILANFVHPVMEVLSYAIPYDTRTVAVFVFSALLFVNATYNMRKMYHFRTIKL
jgi:uncharacterized membrane protein